MATSNDGQSAAYPDEFDRMLGALDGVSTGTVDTVIPVVPVMGVGGTRKFILRTIRHEGADHLFVEMIGRDRSFREYFPPAVTAAIGRQHDALTAKNRRAGARSAARTRKAAGLKPGFQMTPAERAAAKAARKAKAGKGGRR